MDVFVPNETGHWVSEKFQILNEIVHDFDSELDLRFIPADNRKTRIEQDLPFVVIDTTTNSVVHRFRETTTPETVLEKLFMGDNRDGKVLERLDAHNAALKAWKLKNDMDREEEIADQAKFLWDTKKNFIKHKDPRTGQIVKLDDQLRRI